MGCFEQLTVEEYDWPADAQRNTLSPALVVFRDHVRSNISRIIEYVGGDADRWRPHIKTLKIPEIYAELIDAGVRRFKCATLREARVLLQLLDRRGVRGADLLVAYPLVQPGLAAAGAMARAHRATRLSVLCEERRDAEQIDAELGIFIDVNPGQNRTGIPAERSGEIAEIAAAAGGRLRGLHYYDGHLAALRDPERARAAFSCYDRLMELIWKLRRAGHHLEEVITSGTPTFRLAVEYGPFSNMNGPVHRVSPGTAVYHDLRSEEEIDGLELTPAAVVFSRVISNPAPGIATCDAGSKSISTDAGDPCARVIGRPRFEPMTPSEEHLPIRHPMAERPDRGTPLLLVPRHVCTTVNLAESAILVDGGKAAEVSVQARAHDI